MNIKCNALQKKKKKLNCLKTIQKNIPRSFELGVSETVVKVEK